MAKRRILQMKLGLGAMAMLLSIPAACSPQERIFGAGGSGGAGASSSSETSSSSSSVTSSSSASSSSSAGTGGGGGGGGGCPVDADQDGFTSIACGGKDCVDDEKLAYPGQVMWFSTPIPGTSSYDYNCSGAAEAQYIDVLSCLDIFNCDTNTKKWATGALPKCGVVANYGVCQMSGVQCVSIVIGTRAQGCH
jgi:hypothetical protein